MRFDRLDILRYGALTDRSLAFRPNARLHIVYGPNEAGKSSALSAISDLLFGFPDRTPYGFQNEAAALRVGARITSRAGDGLDFRRRKGRRSTLLAQNDAEDALPDDALTPFLGTLGRDVFERAFGLNSASLRVGGQSMLKSGGEIGSLLFSAASGLTGLADMRKALDEEADTIYAPRRSKDRLFYQVLDTHEDARRAERENELKAADWKKLIAEQERIEAELAAIQSERMAAKRQLDRLRTFLNLEPLLREIDREREQLKRYAPLEGLPADFAAQLSTALDAARENAQAQRSADTEAARLKGEIAAVHVDEALIDAIPRILAAHAGKGAYTKAREDLPRVQAEVDDFNLRLAQAARRLGLGGAEELQRAQPADADLARLTQLVGEGEDLHRALRELRHRIDEEADALHRLEADGAGLRLVDPKPWADQLVALRPDLNDLAALDTLKIRAARAEQDFAATAGRLDPPVRDAAELLSLPLPDVATLARHRDLIAAAEAGQAQAARKLDALREETHAVARQLAALEEQGRIVTREEIALSRKARDQALEAVAATPSVSAWKEVRRAVSDADALSDAALSDAERGSQYAQLKLRERDLEASVSAAAAAAREAEIDVSDAVTEFEDLFHAVPVRPSTPEGMIEWRRAVDGIMRLAEARDEIVDQLEALRLKEERLGPVLSALAEAMGIASGTLPPAALHRALEQRVAELTERWNESRSLDRLRRAAAENLARLQEREAEKRAAVDRWQAEISQASVRAGLPEDATIEMVTAALEVWRTVPDILAERENRI
ncbi:MAG TPA: AAA family ATPase, partial [Pseudorhizobium sp.]|nr:AAA family ATPase [Pseudorhizobium sp.]